MCMYHSSLRATVLKCLEEVVHHIIYENNKYSNDAVLYTALGDAYM